MIIALMIAIAPETMESMFPIRVIIVIMDEEMIVEQTKVRVVGIKIKMITIQTKVGPIGVDEIEDLGWSYHDVVINQIQDKLVITEGLWR